MGQEDHIIEEVEVVDLDQLNDQELEDLVGGTLSLSTVRPVSLLS